jgi:Uma2 family endonuclease
MERKFTLYRDAGVREYWVLDPEHKALHVYCFNNGAIFPGTYRSGDVVPLEIFPDLLIHLEPVFAE